MASTAATSAGGGLFRPLQPPAAGAGAADDQSRPPLPLVPLYTTKVPAGDLQVRFIIIMMILVGVVIIIIILIVIVIVIVVVIVIVIVIITSTDNNIRKEYTTEDTKKLLSFA